MLLQSKDYMQIRNALIILMRILPSYPVLSKLSQILEKCVNKVIEEEKNKRQDLFVLATSYIGQLKNKAVDMMKEADFHQVSDKPTKNSQESVKVVNGNGVSAGKHENNHGEFKLQTILFSRMQILFRIINWTLIHWNKSRASCEIRTKGTSRT